MNERMIPGNDISFKYFLLSNKRNRTILWLSAIAIIIQFSVFKYFYPFASFIYGDSFAYLKTAYYNLDINSYMVGYSRFLRFFSAWTNSDTALTAFIYLFIQSSALFLLFTLFYFYRPGIVAKTILLCFSVFNPLFLFLANLISSDGFFLALSLSWFSLIIWIIHRPSKHIIFAHAIILFIAFTVRYNALIYPGIATLAFCLSGLAIRQKVIGITSGILLCALFVMYTSYKHRQLTGIWQYSPFSGWQLANNAMYAYKYIDSADRKPVPIKFQNIDHIVREYFAASRNEIPHPQEAIEVRTIYMWTPGLPLWRYKDSLFKNDTVSGQFKKWAFMGPLYKEYGLFLISKYPWHFARYYLWPSALKYYAPPIEFLHEYNSGRDSVANLAQIWFNYKGPKVKTRTNDYETSILNFYPVLSGLVNIVMLCSLICFTFLKGWKNKGNFRIGILMSGILWFLNAVFTIFASSAALRFQSFPILLTTIFTVFLLDWIWTMAFAQKENSTEIVNNKETVTKAMA